MVTDFSFNMRQINLTGNSMMPSLNPDDIITLLISAPVNLKRGDIIVYRCPGYLTGLCVHRLIRVKGSYLLTKGDNLVAFDALVEQAAVVGKVEKTVKVASGISTIKPDMFITLCSHIEGIIATFLPKKITLCLHKLLLKIYKKRACH